MHVPNLSILVATFFLITATNSQKRAPSGFTGVRGKKFAPDYSEGLTSDEKTQDVIEKRAPSGFLGMRGKKPYEDWAAPQQNYQPDPSLSNKRAPSGFLGMRGKKEVDYDTDYLKRAPSGFLGMRGKKEQDPSNLESIYEKRAPAGFFGMRGKKDEFEIDEKRVPGSGFLGMRGKKYQSRQGFFGMRGKKFPYEFRGKFVGVRGKKMSEPVVPSFYDQPELKKFVNGLDMNQLMLLLTDNDGYELSNEIQENLIN